MDTLYSSAVFSEMTKPFSFFHQISFKAGSPASELFGTSVYGRFLKPVKSKAKSKAIKEESKFHIDAPKINGRNLSMTSENRATLYYQGVAFNDIDIVLSYPDLQ